MKRQKILITGASGLVGSSFVTYVNKNHINYDLLLPDHEQLDIANKKSLRSYLNKNKPGIIINFAAHRNANTAEEQRKIKKELRGKQM